ncbi:hypothetical protein ACHWQZ_G001190 [Mnemiopsis leidyi]
MFNRILAVLSLIGICGALNSPFNSGISGKISKQFIQGFSNEVADATESFMRRSYFSGSSYGSDYRLWYRDVSVDSVSLSPSISLWSDGSASSGSARLGVNGVISGYLSASGKWEMDKEYWFYTANFAGRFDMSASSFSVSNRVILGRKSNGQVGFSRVSGSCSASISGLDVDISGSWFSWIFNFLIWLFKDDLIAKLEDFGCQKVDSVISESLRKYESSMLNKDYIMPLTTGGSMEIGFTPSVITGGSSCAIIVAPSPLDMSGVPRSSSAVTPDEGRKKRNAEGLNPEKEDLNTHVIEKRSSDYCSQVPGGSSAVSIILTSEFVSRLIRNLHTFDLLKFTLVARSTSGNSMALDVTRNGRRMTTFNVQLPEGDGRQFANFTEKKIKISSTSSPALRLTSSGISVSVNLRARVTLTSDDPSLEIRTEFQSRAEWRGTIDLTKTGGRYSFVPRSVSARVNVWTGKIFAQAQYGDETRSGREELDDGHLILEAIERLLNSVLEDNLAGLLQNDVRSGIPINIPYEYVTVGSANIAYNSDYILITANSIGVSLS